jgi:hypothetical protein
MVAPMTEVIARCRKLGLECDEFPADKITSVLGTLCCFPMYMVANVDAWTSDKERRIPLAGLPSIERLRESFATGKQETAFKIDKQHQRILRTLTRKAKPSDLVIYEYALDTLGLVLNGAAPPLAEQIRTAVARMIVAAAQASGEGWLGTGPKVTAAEKACIQQIAETLSLGGSPAAAAALKDVL